MLNIVLPQNPVNLHDNHINPAQPYNLFSILKKKAKFRSEMKQYEERLALLEKQWPGLKACKYDVDWYSRKCLYGFLKEFQTQLFHIETKCVRIKELRDAIEKIEPKEPLIIDVVPRKDTPIGYHKEIIVNMSGFGVLDDLYNLMEDAQKEVAFLNQDPWRFGFAGKHFFVISINYENRYLMQIAQETRGHINPYYAVACCPSRYLDIVGIKDKDKEIKNLEKRLQELKINKIMADNGFDENGRLLKKIN